MKLISMTDFVLEQMNEVMLDGTGTVCARLGNYAQFLKKPLTIGMFVPCDEDGNVLEEPKDTNKCSLAYDWLHEQYRHKQAIYQQAKERVLFGGFVIENIFGNKAICYDDYGNYIYIYEFPSLIIEDLIKCDLTLTESALKKIGI